jgi:hypothetical protein
MNNSLVYYQAELAYRREQTRQQLRPKRMRSQIRLARRNKAASDPAA